MNMRTLLRPLVFSLPAIIALILLNASNHAEAQTPEGVGIMYLTNSDGIGDPIHAWSGDPSLINPFVQGVALRTQWGRVEPHEHANADDFYWDFLDQGVAMCAAYGKKVSILVTAGVTTPQWVYDAGATSFNVTEQAGYSSITDGVTIAGSTRVRSARNTAGWTSDSIGLSISGRGIPPRATVITVNSRSEVTISVPATESATGVAIVTAKISPMPLPWDPVFQAKWGAFIRAFAARYGNNPNLAYVVMGGPGRRAESFFCFTAEDMNYFTNTLGGLPNWEQGVKWIIDQYGTYFPNTPFILDMGSPIPTSAGNTSLGTVCNYGAARYPGNHFGVKSDGLQYPSGPPIGSMGHTEVALLSPTSTVGYQFYLPQGGAVDPATGRLMLDLGLERGISFGAHFIEVYAQDCDDPRSASLLTAAAARLTSIAPRAAIADFNGDGHPDYALRNAGTRETAIWYLNNNVLTSGAVGPTLAAGWGLKATGDFNLDGHSDYSLFAPSTHQTAIWYLSGPTTIGGALGPTLPHGWELVGTADFDGDSKPDYLLYNASTHQTAVWYLNNNVLVSGAFGLTLPTGWSVIGVADFNGDGHPDYLLSYPSLGYTAIAYLSGTTVIGAAWGPTVPGNWTLVAAADFNGDSHPDYLLYNASTRQTAIWYLNNSIYVSGAFGPTLPVGWSLIGL